MAVFTALGTSEASRITRAHGLGDCRQVVPIDAGSVNSNFFLEADRRVFCRIYEDQGPSGVAYEWALMDHLAAGGVSLPRRVAAALAPGELRVEGKPAVLFEIAGGAMVCQRGVTEAHAQAVGALIGRTHQVGRDFGWRRRGRFTHERLCSRAARFDASWDGLGRRLTALTIPPGLPAGVIHGDLFRDNVLFQEGQGSGCTGIDWESASHGVWLFDLAVCVAAWCFGDAFDWGLIRAMCRGYEAERTLAGAERDAFFDVLRAACGRFAITRIADFELRGTSGVHKDYRRFIGRLDEIEALGPRAVVAKVW